MPVSACDQAQVLCCEINILPSVTSCSRLTGYSPRSYLSRCCCTREVPACLQRNSCPVSESTSPSTSSQRWIAAPQK
ncbi:hypothetical protein scyTo_0010849 [Scyliorhinus torazame]|uniref:Uncharacterized protein n=1 Tax=Scyliorhinus torazame TaxID=75743 RepID=A0A401PCD7_SCYTO|nr:hypothetical protein [Scyliorhinus torazame]